MTLHHLRHLGLALLSLLALPTAAQEVWHELRHDIYYNMEGQTTFGASANNPFWLAANRYGASSIEGDNSHLRLAITRPIEADSNRVWRIGAGIDALWGSGLLSPVQLQQAYVQLGTRHLTFTLGQKQERAMLRNSALSTGAMLLGENARPVPSVRLETPQWLHLDTDGRWLALHMHLAYGIMTDGPWQKSYVGPTGRHANQTLLHTKSGYVRIGNPDFYRLTFVGGLEMATQFGGTIYNPSGWGGTLSEPLKMGGGLKNFFYALVGSGGNDATDGAGYENNAGNTLGSWRASLEYRPTDAWAIRAYYDHFFDDHSAAFDEYGWLDGQYGLELRLPPNRFVSNLVFEHQRTDYQSGPIYHDKTAQVNEQISGIDNYYNHNLYPGWQHYGMALGNALFASPLYERTQSLAFVANRFRANHIGLSGQPLPQLSYRLLYTHLRSWGTYHEPSAEVEHQHSLLAELNYRFLTRRERHLGNDFHQRSWREGWSVRLALGLDRGTRLGNNFGVQIAIAKTGLLTKY